VSDKRRVETSTTSAAFRAKAAAEESKRDLDAATAGNSDSDELGEQIEQTRADMAETIDAIQDKLDPRTLKQQARDAARAATVGRVESAVSAADEKAHQLVQTLGERTTTIKAGASQQAQRVVSKVRTIREPGAAGDLADQASSALADQQRALGQWQDKAAQARQAAGRALQSLETQVRRRPLAGCLVALTLGAMLGWVGRASTNGHDREPDVGVVPTATPEIRPAGTYTEV
jgi:hypothetical protein